MTRFDQLLKKLFENIERPLEQWKTMFMSMLDISDAHGPGEQPVGMGADIAEEGWDGDVVYPLEVLKQLVKDPVVYNRLLEAIREGGQGLVDINIFNVLTPQDQEKYIKERKEWFIHGDYVGGEVPPDYCITSVDEIFARQDPEYAACMKGLEHYNNYWRTDGLRNVSRDIDDGEGDITEW